MKKKLPLIVLIVVLVALAGFFWTSKGGFKSSQSGVQQEAAKEMMANCKYDKSFCEYMVAQAQAMQGGVIISSVSEVAGYGTATSEMKYDKNGNTEVNTYKDGQLETSMIEIGNDTYVKDSKDGAWYLMPAYDYKEEGKNDNLSEIKETYEFEDGIQINKVGTEACGSLTCDKYEMTIPLNEDGQGAKTYVWVDTKEHLARKMEYSYSGNVSTMEYKYESVEIAKPSPIKEMPSMMDSSNDDESSNQQVPSQADIEKMMQEYSLDGE